MARENRIIESGIPQSEIMAEWNAGGERRTALVALLGFASANGMYNALRDLGWIPGGKMNRSPSGNGSPRSTKIKGCLPKKIMYRIAKILDLDLEESDEPGWQEFLTVCELDPDFEGFSMVRLAGGEESDGGKSYRQWIDSNRANDRAIAEKLARESDPTFKLQQKIASLVGTIAERDAEITRLESELESAKLSSKPQRGPVMGGELNNDMLRIMKQRFHPDKNNGSPELCEAVMKWLNAIVL